MTPTAPQPLRSLLRPAQVALGVLALAACGDAQRARAVSPAPAAPLFDCNGNGVEDAVDIAVGASSDANRNGVPDECEGGCAGAKRTAGSAARDA